MQSSEAEADRAFDIIVKAGVNHIDVAASYGEAEERIRPWLARVPGEFFLATKTGEREGKEAREELERSLERMGVDHVDLWQMHNLADPIEWDIALSPGGAVEAAVAARDEGLVRFIGVTGHGLQIAATHRRSLERFDFDTVLLPYNYVTMQNEYYAENFEALVSTCAERNVAVQTIKVDRRGALGGPGAHRTPRGTNRSPTRPTSTWPCHGYSGAPAFSSTPSPISNCYRWSCRRPRPLASGPLTSRCRP